MDATPPPPYDAAKAAELVGKRILVGLTTLDHQGRLLERRQFLGTVVRVDEEEGVVVTISGSTEEFRFPPDLRAFRKADKGQYRMRSTGERVVDPDFLTSWTMTAKPYTGDEP